MSIDDYLLDLLLIAVVVRQLRGRRLTPAGLLWPVPLVLWAAARYLHGVPLHGHSAVLVAGGITAGVVLGAACASLTTVRRRPDGAVIATATGAAALLWILGTGSRLAFGIVATHGGGLTIARFSAAHDIAVSAWTAALLFMALGEVLVRAAALGVKAHRAGGVQEPTRDRVQAWTAGSGAQPAAASARTASASSHRGRRPSR